MTIFIGKLSNAFEYIYRIYKCLIRINYVNHSARRDRIESNRRKNLIFFTQECIYSSVLLFTGKSTE